MIIWWDPSLMGSNPHFFKVSCRWDKSKVAACISSYPMMTMTNFIAKLCLWRGFLRFQTSLSAVLMTRFPVNKRPWDAGKPSPDGAADTSHRQTWWARAGDGAPGGCFSLALSNSHCIQLYSTRAAQKMDVQKLPPGIASAPCGRYRWTN